MTPRALAVIWADRQVRASAFGYFGHMWGLYALLVLIPAVGLLFLWPMVRAGR